MKTAILALALVLAGTAAQARDASAKEKTKIDAMLKDAGLFVVAKQAAKFNFKFSCKLDAADIAAGSEASLDKITAQIRCEGAKNENVWSTTTIELQALNHPESYEIISYEPMTVTSVEDNDCAG